MVKNYEDWKKNVEFYASVEGVSPEIVILCTYLGVVEQYLKSSESVACRGVLERASDCVKRYLGL